jgi:hypothetical protein
MIGSSSLGCGSQANYNTLVRYDGTMEKSVFTIVPSKYKLLIIMNNKDKGCR